MKYLTPNEAARFLAVDADTVRRWIRAGRLPAARTPGRRGRLRIAEADLVLALAPACRPKDDPDGKRCVGADR